MQRQPAIKEHFILWQGLQGIRQLTSVPYSYDNVLSVMSFESWGQVLSSVKVHVEKKIEKALRAFWQCRRSFDKSRALRLKVIMWIYNAVF